ncbi:MAG: hypothetical protein KDK08_28540 [Rhizobiaceae bacterium]|nr:hypothetical protein [Rhizobiaceae bacterium]
MKHFQSNFRSVAAININLLTSLACGFAAWAIWPQSAEWWGLGVLSIMLGLSAIVGVGKALSLMATLYNKGRVMNEYMAQGGKPKSAHMASNTELDRAGMFDD